MVYRLSKMGLKTKVLFFCLIWIFSALTAIIGVIFISTAAVIPGTPYRITESNYITNVRINMGQFEAWGVLNYGGLRTIDRGLTSKRNISCKSEIRISKSETN